jgi:hypothetical protein
MPRQSGTSNKITIEYQMVYDQMVKKYGDPVEVLFRLLKSRKQGIRIQAASTLVSYKYPKLAAAAIGIEGPGQLSLSWNEDTSELDIQANQPDPRIINEIEGLADARKDGI